MKKISKNALVGIVIGTVIGILIIVAIINGIIESNAGKAQTEAERQKIFSIMEQWADGVAGNNGDIGSWRNITDPEIEKKAVEIVKNKKDNLENLSFFLNRLEWHGYEKPSIKAEIAKMELSIDQKLIVMEKYLNYYSFSKITKTEIENYVAQHGRNELHLTAGTGGYYDGNKDYSRRKTIGVSGSPLYESEEVNYFGDFKRKYESGVKLNSTY